MKNINENHPLAFLSKGDFDLLYYEVTELNTHVNTFDNEIEEILYGKGYKTYRFSNLEDAKAKEKELNEKNIITNIAQVTEYCRDNKQYDLKLSTIDIENN